MGKRVTLAALLFLFVAGQLRSQAPQGMNYQAVARDIAGSLLANKSIAVRISLLQGGIDGAALYTETHNATTNQFGLFTLVIGQGKPVAGAFSEIPWGSSQIWMKVEMDGNGRGDFALMNTTQLFAVPYAFYAMSAGSLVTSSKQDGTGGKGSFKPSLGGVWQMDGNYNTNPPIDFLGTMDKNDLVFKTNGKERLVIRGSGDTHIRQALRVSDFITSRAEDYFGAPIGAGLFLVDSLAGLRAISPLAAYAPPPSNLELYNYHNGNIYINGQNTGVGVANTNQPGSKLSVTDGLAVGTTYSLRPITAPPNGVIIEGNTGIGTFAPTYKLQVVGNTYLNGDAGITGITHLFNTTQATSPYNGALIVDGGAGIAKSLFVGMNLTVMGMGTFTDLTVIHNAMIGNDLSVTHNGTFGNNLTVAGITHLINTTQSTTVANGALIVDGGTGIAMNLNVGGITRLLNATSSTDPTTGALLVTGGVGLSQNLNIAGFTRSFNTTETTSPTTGAVIVDGGVGINKSLFVGGNFTVSGTGTFGDLVVKHTATIGGLTHITDLTQSTAPTNGALVVDGGTGIGKNLNVGGDMNVTGNETVTHKLAVGSGALGGSDLTVNAIGSDSPFLVNGTSSSVFRIDNDGRVYAKNNHGGSNNSPDGFAMRLDAQDHGLAIRLNNGTPDSNDKYVTFFDNSNNARGRIEGQTAGDVASDPAYIVHTLIDGIGIAMAAANTIAAATSTTPCVGLGVCETVPIPSLIVATVLNDIQAALILTSDQAFFFDNVGISYASGGADYAEWLERADPAETLSPSDIVGVVGGKISRMTAGAQNFMVVSKNPAVVGNMPSTEREQYYTKVAFMGQVPVKVRGPVHSGDYIVPTGFNDGYGIAVAPDKMTAEHYGQVVGRAWENGNNIYLNTVNASVGVDRNDLVSVVKRQQSEIDQLKQDVASIKNMIASLNGAAASTPSTGAAITPPVNATPAIPAPMLQQSLKPRTVNPYAAYAFEGEQVSPQVLRLAIQTVRESLTTRFGKVPERLAKLLDDPASVQKIIDQTQKELKDMRAIMHKVDQEPLQIQNSGK